jgi:hypothetical protein
MKNAFCLGLFNAEISLLPVIAEVIAIWMAITTFAHA